MFKVFATRSFLIFVAFVLSNLQLGFCGVEPFQFGSKIQGRGEIQQHLEDAVGRLESGPLDNMEFVLSDVHFRNQRRFTNYSGDVSGRMLGAFNSSVALVKHEIPFLYSLRNAIPAFQKSDGHFGVEQDLANKPSQEKDMPILWGNGRLLLAMAEYCRDNNDRAFLQSAQKLGDYIISTRKYFGKEENFTKVGGLYASGFTTCYPSLIDGLACLGEVSGQKKYYDEARHIARLSLLDKEFDHHHSHGRLTAYRGMLNLDYFTGTDEFVPAVIAGCKVIREKYLLPTDGVTEVFDLDYEMDEGCSEADWISVNLLLWRATAETEYLDMAESALRNHLLSNQFSNGGFGHFVYAPLGHGGQAFQGGKIKHFGTESYWCCSMHGAQILGDITRWSILQSDKKLWITWLAEVCAEFTVDGQQIKAAVQKKCSGLWQVVLKSPSKSATVLKLRVPGWAKAIEVDGKRCKVVKGWADVPCDWAGELKLQVKLSTEVKLAGGCQLDAMKDSPVRVFYGPDMYGLPEVFVGKDFWPEKFVPEIIMSEQISNPEQIPVLLKGPDSRLQRSRLVPLLKCPAGGRVLLFDVKMVESEVFDKLGLKTEPMPEAGTLVKINFACDGTYEMYMNGEKLLKHSGWEGSPGVSVYTREKKNVLTVKASSKASRPALMGTIQVGDQILATRADNVTVLGCPGEMPHSWLTDPAQWQQKVRAKDLGGYGDAPWGHGPAQFAGTKARWIWPEQIKPSSEHVGWLFCFVFDTPEK